MLKKSVFVICIMALAIVVNAEPVTIVFQDGLTNAFYTDNDTTASDWYNFAYDGTHDTYVTSYGSSRAYCFGKAWNMSVGNPNWNACQQGHMKFDLSCLAGKTITGATLDIWSRGCGYPDQELTVHPMQPANGGWLEGGLDDGNCAARIGQPGDSTWLFKEVTTGGVEGTQAGVSWAGAYGPVNWANPAYDGMPPYPDTDLDTVIATLMRTDNLSTSYQGWTFEVPTSIVQGWVIPDIKDAAGIVFKASATGYDPEVDPWYYPYHSPSMVNILNSDYAKPQYTYAFRPKLTVEYVPEPMTMVLLGLGGLLIRRKR